MYQRHTWAPTVLDRHGGNAHRVTAPPANGRPRTCLSVVARWRSLHFRSRLCCGRLPPPPDRAATCGPYGRGRREPDIPTSTAHGSGAATPEPLFGPFIR